MSVTVIGPNARRIKVNVTPNTTLQEVSGMYHLSARA